MENTYLATFRALGGLGLILGTIGLAAILLRNVLERRKELALLRAVGYRPRHVAAMVIAENLLLLLLGLATGTACALLAIAPAIASRGGHLPFASIGTLLAAVLATGILASLAATAAALRSPLLAGLVRNDMLLNIPSAGRHSGGDRVAIPRDRLPCVFARFPCPCWRRTGRSGAARA